MPQYRIGQSRTLAAAIASRLEARENCRKANNQEWLIKHEDAAREAVSMLPHGSGIDGDTVLDLDASKPDRLVIHLSFHHMDSNGFYDGWTDHSLIVTPSLAHGFNLRITGQNRNEIKDYLAELMQDALSRVYAEVWSDEDGLCYVTPEQACQLVSEAVSA